jgi:hypothetical protein
VYVQVLDESVRSQTKTRGALFNAVAHPMPLDDNLIPEARPLYNELSRLLWGARGTIDSFIHNWGTGIALAASGAATVVAGINPIVGASLAALATFSIGLGRSLQFGKRWAWGLNRQNVYHALIYELNGAALLDRAGQLEKIAELYRRMAEERICGGIPPGADESTV